MTIEFSSQRNQAERENLLLNTAAAQAQKEIAQRLGYQTHSAVAKRLQKLRAPI